MSSLSRSIAVNPVITYPRVAQVGKTYLMTIDLEVEESGWQYEEEEYPIYCKVDSEPLFCNQAVSEPVIILHRFGGSYGEVRFLLIAVSEEMHGEIRVTLVNRWGVLVRQICLEPIRIIQAPLETSDYEFLTDLESLRHESEPQKLDIDSEIDILVTEIRKQIRSLIHKQCGMMRVLDMTQPIELTGNQGIYTDVNILEKMTRLRQLGTAELIQQAGLEGFERFGLSGVVERIPGLEAVRQHRNLMVLGKPGAGKTTFLKFLAMSCLDGDLLNDKVPVFIALREFAEAEGKPSLMQFIEQYRVSHDAQTLISQGRGFFLLDGLDEVRDRDQKRVIGQIQQFSNQYPLNQFVITCRIAAKEYTFEKFTEVEVADFSSAQIETFVRKWFGCKDSDGADVAIDKLLGKLKENDRIRELASSPLLLTLLCLEFEDSSDFPESHAYLYERGLKVLMSKWDASRRIKRDQIYKRLSLKGKEDLLSQIALKAFTDGNYFFKQRTVEAYIADYIANLPDAKDDPGALLLDSEAVLKSIESQHGLLVERARSIYSFSHLTFQEFFAARQIADNDALLEQAASHIMEKRWHEVLFLAVEMSPDAGNLLLLMKQQVNQIFSGDQNIQHFLDWLDIKTKTIRSTYSLVALRALYYAHTLDFPTDLVKFLEVETLPKYISTQLPVLSFKYALQDSKSEANRELDCDITLTHALAPDLLGYIDYSLDYDTAIQLGLISPNQQDVDRNSILYRACVLALELALTRATSCCGNRDVDFYHKLQNLRRQLPSDAFEEWWTNSYVIWLTELRAAMIEHRNIGHDWQLNSSQKEKLKQYYDASLFLLQCLKSDCYVSRQVRQEIIDSLFLPAKDLP